LIVPAGILAQIHRKAIIAMATRHRLPAVYPCRFFAADGGLVSCGPDLIDQYRRAAATLIASLRVRSGRPAGASADQVRIGYQP
jgi:putative ABC transport system substrate-binding protein